MLSRRIGEWNAWPVLAVLQKGAGSGCIGVACPPHRCRRAHDPSSCLATRDDRAARTVASDL